VPDQSGRSALRGKPIPTNQSQPLPMARRLRAMGTLATLCIALLGLAIQASAVPLHAQQGAPRVTPQPPQPDGSIIHEVRQGDTIFGIAAAYNVTFDELLRLNPIFNERRTLFIGQKVLVRPAPTPTLPENATVIVVTSAPPTSAPATGSAAAGATGSATVSVPPSAASAPAPTGKPISVTEATATPPNASPAADFTQLPTLPAEASPTASPAASEPPTQPATLQATQPAAATAPPTMTLTPSPVFISGTLVCALVFNDTNTNGWRDTGEALLAGFNVAAALQAASSPPAAPRIATRDNGLACFADLPAGSYLLSVSSAADYGFTTPAQLNVEVRPGSRLEVSFGAARSYRVEQAATPAALSQASAAGSGSVSAAPPIGQWVASNSGLLIMAVAALLLVGGFSVVLIARSR
jgi:LysM repeat protein